MNVVLESGKHGLELGLRQLLALYPGQAKSLGLLFLLL